MIKNIIIFIKEHLKVKALRKLNGGLIVTQEIVLKDKYGKILEKHFKVSKSLVGNFLQMLWCDFSTGNITEWVASTFNGTTNNSDIKDVGGGITFPIALTSNFNMLAATGSSNNGIIFGTGSTAPDPLDFQVETKIANGVGAGQMNYVAQAGIQAPQVVGSVTSIKIQRIASNNSGAGITVNELVIYNTVKDDTATVCIYRDLTGGIVVANLQTITATLTFEITT